MARFEQYNLHPGRNRHYQTGRQRDPWHIRQRMVMVPVPTDHVTIDVQFDIYDTAKKKHSSYYTYRFFLHVCPLSSMAEEDELLCEIGQRSTAGSKEMIHHHRHEEPERLIVISQGKQYLVPRYNTDPRLSDKERYINISKDLTNVTVTDLDHPEDNNYYTIASDECNWEMDEPEQMLASVIKALRTEQR